MVERAFFQDQGREPTHAELLRAHDLGVLVMQRIENKLDDLVRVVGFTDHDERGELIGTGLAGDFARHKAATDRRFARDDAFLNTWRGRIVGWLAAAMIGIATVRYILENDISGVLK